MSDKELHGHSHEHHHHHEGCGCDHEHLHDAHECHDPHCTDPSHHHHHHEHEHHHAHECHDPDCSCHEHEHHHHHHHSEGLVSISHHDAATIGAMKGVMPVSDYDEAEALLAEQMREAGRRITEAGGIIGHIKFMLSTADKCGQISVTDVNETIRRFQGSSSTVEGVAIVFAIDDDTLTDILVHTIGQLFAKNG